MRRRGIVQKSAAVAAATITAVAGAAFWAGGAPRPDPGTVAVVQAAAMVPAPATVRVSTPAVQPPAPESVAEPPAAAGPASTIDAVDRARLAAEMSRWSTRHPRQLVDLIADLAESQPLSVSPAYLLSIAWSETRGRILAVSPAGAAGLAQATPAAYLSENLDGTLFITTDYLMATRAYVMKKPLGDALTISKSLLEKNTAARRARARRLTARAIELRREGIDELEALRPVANATFFRRIAEGEALNLRTLRTLDRLIARGAPKASLKAFHRRVQRDHTYLRNLQRRGWSRYARALTARRDALLRAHYKQPAPKVIASRPYQAGEYLARVLDARFSPTNMAKFLAAHVETKQGEARALGVDEAKLDTWTAALYNGGAINIKRMRAGLISKLSETQKYMKSVPARSARLAELL